MRHQVQWFTVFEKQVIQLPFSQLEWVVGMNVFV